MRELIYLDNNATTPLDPRVLESMMPFLSPQFGNASSSHHFGLSINKAVTEAREKVAGLIGSDAAEIIFTSGATESINLALKGFALANQHKGKHIVTVQTEHKAVLDTCKYLETIGFEVTYLPVKKDGLIDLQELKNVLRSDTILVSVMLANNETGVLQPIKEIATITHESGVIFFTDATQAIGKIEVDAEEFGIDMMAFSGHKFYGPKGIGGLFVKGLKSKNLKLTPLLHGGGHESALRSGTLNVPGIIGLGKASEISKDEMKADAERILVLRDELEKELLKMPGAFVNGSIESRMYNVSSICFPGMDANMMIGKMNDIALSNGSACSSALFEPSHVLRSMGLSDNDTFATIRFSLGRFNSRAEVSSVTQTFCNILSLSIVN